MICKSCNKTIGDNVNFCPFCGQKTAAEKKICPSCNKEYDAENVFCENCGMKLVEKSAQSMSTQQNTQNNTQQNTQQNTQYNSQQNTQYNSQQNTQQQIQRQVSLYPSLSYNMSMYEGTGGVAKASGKLKVYGDRLEFEKKFGNAAAGAFGLVGMAIASSQAKKNGAVDTYYYRDIARVSKGSIMFCPSVVLYFKNGRTISFAGAGMGGNVDSTINIIGSNLG